jgi:hypothetical protein
MAIACILRFHSWNGCSCSKCGKIRDEGHNWSQDCEKCSKCGTASTHNWDGCKCKRCGKTRDKGHDWPQGCEKCSKCGTASTHNWDGCKCKRCGKTRDKGHDWSQGCEKCSKCGVAGTHNWDGCKCVNCGHTRYESHAWDGCKCIRCGKSRDKGHTWKTCKCTKCGYVKDSRTQPFCLFCESDISEESHGQLHKWLIENKGRLTLLTRRSPEGIIESSLWRVGEITTYNSRQIEKPILFCGIHKYQEILYFPMGASTIDITTQYISIIKGYKTEWVSNGRESWDIYVPCDPTESSKNETRLDIVLVPEYIQSDDISVYPPLMGRTIITIKGHDGSYPCGELAKYEYPSTAIYGTGVYYILDSHSNIIYMSYALNKPIKDQVESDLTHNFYTKDSFVLIFRVSVNPNQIITPLLITAIYDAIVNKTNPKTHHNTTNLENNQVEIKVLLTSPSDWPHFAKIGFKKN